MSGGACSVRVLSGGDPTPPEHVTRATSGRAFRGSSRSRAVLVDRRDCRGRRRRSASITRKRDRIEYAGDGRRSGWVKIVVFDETASGGCPGTISTRGSHPEQRWRDRERQRQDQGPRLRLKKPERPGSVARRDRGHGLIRVERCWTPREGTRGSSVIGAEAGGSPSSEVPLDHAHREVSARRAAWKPTSPAKAGGEGDSRIERSKGCSSRKIGCRSWKDASSPAGRSRPQGRERRRRVSLTRRLHVDHGSAIRGG